MLEAAIAEIISPAGRGTAGCGVAIFPRGLVATCAHVVADALGLDRDSPDITGHEVDVCFRFCRRSTRGRVVAWSPLSASDVAVIRVPDGAVAEPVRAVPLFHSPAIGAVQFRTYGFPRGYASGRWAYGELFHHIAGGHLQARSSELAPGFSGGPVQELQLGRVIGLFASYEAQTGTGFAITAAQIATVCTEAYVARAQTCFSPLTDGLIGLPGDPLTGVEMFLTEYLGTPDRPRGFGGRTGQFAQLTEWLASSASATALVAAPAGRGKSALLVRWAIQLCALGVAEVAFIPVSIRFNTAAKLRFAMLLGARLRHLVDPGLRSTGVNSDPDHWIAEIGHWLRQDRVPGSLPLVIILDGLDEATDWKAGEDFNVPPALGAGIKVIASARTLALDRSPRDWLNRLGWPASALALDLPPLGLPDVTDVLCSMGDPLQTLASHVDVVAELTRLSEGDPLLISLYVDALRGSGENAPFIRPEQLTSIPAGLDGYLEAWWRDQRRQWGELSPLKEAGVQTAMHLLACALAPLTRNDVLELAPTELSTWVLDDVLGRLSRFVIGDGVVQGFVFAHPRLGQYFQSKLSAGERHVWNSRFIGYGRRVLAELRSGVMQSSAAPAYVVQNHVAHLDRGPAESAQYYDLLHESWLRAWEHQDGSLSGFFKDVVRVWDQADKGQEIRVQLLSTLCHSSLVSLRAAAPPELIAQALHAALFTENQVLALMDSLPDEHNKSRLISCVAEHLTARGREALLLKALQFGDEEARAVALQDLIPHLPHYRWGDVIHASGGLQDDLCFLVLQAVARVLVASGRPYLVEDVFVAVERIQDDELRAQLLRELAPALSPALASRLLRLARLLMKPSARAQVLALLAPLITEDLVPDALATACQIWYPYRRFLALASLIGSVPTSARAAVVTQALGAAREIREPERKAEALVRISAAVDETETDFVLNEALDTIDAEVVGGQRANLLSAFPRAQTFETRARVASISEKCMDVQQQLRLLARQLWNMEPAEQESAMARAGKLMELIGDIEILPVLRSFALAAPPQAVRRMSVAAQAIRGPDRQALALSGLSVALPDDEQAELLAKCVSTVLPRVDDWKLPPVHAWHGFISIAQTVSPSGAKVMREILLTREPARWYYGERDALMWLEALSILTDRSHDQLPDEILDRCLELIADFRSRDDVASGLNAIAPLLRGDALRRAVRIAWRIGDRGDLSAVLDAIGRLPVQRSSHSAEPDVTALLSLARIPSVRSYSTGFCQWAIAVALCGSDVETARNALDMYRQLGIDARAHVISLSAPHQPPQQIRSLCAEWLRDAQVAREISRGHENYENSVANSVGELKRAIPEELLSRFFDLLSSFDSAERIRPMLAIAARLPPDARRVALQAAGAALQIVENPVARAEILVHERTWLGKLSTGELQFLAGMVGDQDSALAALAQLCPYLNDSARPEVIDFVVSGSRAASPELRDRIMLYLAPALPADIATSALWELLERQDFGAALPAFVAAARAIPSTRRTPFVTAAQERIAAMPYSWSRQEAAAMMAEICPDREWLLSQYEQVTGEIVSWSPGSLRALLAAGRSPEEVLEIVEKCLFAYNAAELLDAVLPELPADALPRAIALVRQSPEPGRLADQFVRIASRMPLRDFVRELVRARASHAPWDWGPQGLQVCMDIAAVESLERATFRSASEVTEVLRDLGRLDRPDCVAILRYLVPPAHACSGLRAAAAMANAVVLTGQWWP